VIILPQRSWHWLGMNAVVLRQRLAFFQKPFYAGDRIAALSLAGFAGCLPLVLAVGLLLAAAMPVAADPSDYLVEASMLVSRSEASAEDVLTFWISIDRLGAKARYLTIRETMPVGLALISTAEPSSCAVTNGTWLCDQRDRTPFVIEVQTIVQPGSEDQRLVNVARIEVLYHEEVRAFIEVSAGVLVVPESEVGEPDLSVRVSVAQGAVMPGSDLNYRINVTNNGTAPATNVSIVVSMPTVMVLLSASPLPMAQDGGLRWTVESLPVCSLEILFNLTLPMALELDHVQVAVAATYGDGNGDDVRVEGLPLSLSVVPAAPPGSMVPGRDPRRGRRIYWRRLARRPAYSRTAACGPFGSRGDLPPPS